MRKHWRSLLQKQKVMAKKITAIRKYRPELKRMRAMQTAELVDDIAWRASLDEGEIRFVNCEVREPKNH